MKDNVKVYVNKTPSGDVSKEGNRYIFNYHEEARDIVSLTMPIRRESWISPELHPIFQMSLPEGALKETIKKHFSKIQNMDDINLLKLIGPYMLGRIKFDKIVKPEETLVLEDILKSSTEDLFDELMQRFAIHSGVSGVQPKLLLSAHNRSTMRFEHYIVKSWKSDYPQLALNEYFCMRAVQNANLPTPEFYLSDDLSMFITKRFDIKEDGTYLGFEDMCVLTARGTDEKYDGSYEEISKVIKDVISPAKRREALKQLFTALIMNHFLQNGDGHLKNYAVIYSEDFEDARLAPIYDVITTTMYIKKDIPALKLGDAKLWWKEKSYKTFAKLSCGLSNKEYDEILETCQRAIMITKQEVDLYAREHEKNAGFLSSLKSCWKDSFRQI